MAKYTYSFLILALCAGAASAQTLTEFGGAAAGGAVGAASGKAVSNGIDAVFGKLNDQTVKAAGKEEGKPKAEVKPDAAPKPDVKPAAKQTASTSAPSPVSAGGSGVNPFAASSRASGRTAAKHVAAAHVRSDPDDSVPPPPPIAGHGRNLEPPRVTAQQIAFAPLTLADALPAQPIAPPPAMTPEKLQQVTVGMRRADVLKLGEPSSRIQMFEDEHMVEIFSYRADGERFGRLRLEDGAVAKIEKN
jgi:hypothetical protein